MIVVSCQHESVKRNGKDHKGQQRYRCQNCGKTWIERENRPLGNMRIDMKQAVRALGMLLEGLSVRATARLLGMDAGTICDLVVIVGENCQRLLNAKVRGVEVKDVEAGEVWSFIGCKEKNRVASGKANYGDSWTWLAIERE